MPQRHLSSRIKLVKIPRLDLLRDENPAGRGCQAGNLEYFSWITAPAHFGLRLIDSWQNHR
ncbi:MAG TPA: hypothetical protein VLD83_15070, partial [Candidatus Binatia bacterium]|nr:hypothetical protein [Candidatus Binatia bacterium]